jgi:hypothetical protein
VLRRFGTSCGCSRRHCPYQGTLDGKLSLSPGHNRRLPKPDCDNSRRRQCGNDAAVCNGSLTDDNHP